MESLSENLTRALNEITDRNILTLEQLQKRILHCLKELSENESLHVLESFLSNDLAAVEDKELFLYESFLDHVNSNQKPESLIVYLASDIKDISDKAKILELLERTRYTLTISSGQRRYGGPPPHWDGPPPGTGDEKFCSQVHIGKLEPRTFEDVLVPVLEECGHIYQLRIMVNSQTGENKGYAFVDFFTSSEAEKFISTYDGKSIGSSPPISVKLTVPNCRIFVAGFSSLKSKDEVENEFRSIFENLVDVKAFPGATGKRKNRGYVFLTFKTHDDASKARKKLQRGIIKVFNEAVREAEWAESADPTEETDIKPQTLYVRFGSSSITDEVLRNIFQEFGEIKSIDMFREFAFIEFATEEAASNALSVNERQVQDTMLTVGYSRTKKEGIMKKSKPKRRSGRQRDSRYLKQFRPPLFPRNSVQSDRNTRRDEYYYPPGSSYRGSFDDRRFPPNPPPHHDVYNNPRDIAYGSGQSMQHRDPPYRKDTLDAYSRQAPYPYPPRFGEDFAHRGHERYESGRNDWYPPPPGSGYTGQSYPPPQDLFRYPPPSVGDEPNVSMQTPYRPQPRGVSTVPINESHMFTHPPPPPPPPSSSNLGYW